MSTNESRVNFNIPSDLHRTIKHLATAKSTSIKEVFLAGIRELLKNEPTLMGQGKPVSQEEATEILKPLSDKIIAQLEAGEITDDEFYKEFDKVKDCVTEDECDRIMKPYLNKLTSRLKEEKEGGVSWDELKAQLRQEEDLVTS